MRDFIDLVKNIPWVLVMWLIGSYLWFYTTTLNLIEKIINIGNKYDPWLVKLGMD